MERHTFRFFNPFIPETKIISGTGMKLLMNGPKSGEVDVGIDLRRLDGGVTEDLLDHPQVGSTGKKMGCEAMSEGVGGDGV